jgi:error-prone DNA polymerase
VNISYAELHCRSNFSFLRGASSAGELFARAKQLGYTALAITDECSLAGIVRALEAAEKHDLPLIVGSEFALDDGPRLVLLCESREGYERLSALITRGRMAAAKGEYRLKRADVEAVGGEGLLALWVGAAEAAGWEPALRPSATPRRADLDPPLGTPNPPAAAVAAEAAPATAVGAAWIGRCRRGFSPDQGLCESPGPGAAVAAEAAPTEASIAGSDETTAAWLKSIFPSRLWLAVELHCDPRDGERLAALRAFGAAQGIPLVAAGDVHMHARGRRALQDTLTAIRLRCTVAEAGHALFANGERHLRTRAALASLYPPELLEESAAIARRCRFSLRELNYAFPQELVPNGRTPSEHLRSLTEEGAQRRWPNGVPPDARTLIEKELGLIAEMKYEAFFLTVHDIVAWARSQRILCQGRGSAANSVVCYCLGITAVGPDRIRMLFERFVSKERNEPPDIDVDFEHERREEVLQYVYATYGRERAALAATVICYRSKSAARDVGRALGLSEDQLDQLARAYARGQSEVPLPIRLREVGFDPESPLMRRFVALTGQLRGFPRHLSQHVGGFVISGQALSKLVPTENAAMDGRSIIQWDKDDLETLGLLKVDCLALGMLSCVRRCLDLIERHHGQRWQLATIPEGDGPTYAMLQRADTLGVFQVESRAQMAMLPRLKPADFYDLVIQVAIVRPGPIQGDMVHPFLRRRQGFEPVSYPSPELEQVFGRTLGVPIFQEQVMHLAMVAAGFTPGEADQLRRSMAAWKRHGGLEHWRERILSGMAERGYELEFAERVFEQIKGFGSYGFPESHAASFALIAYVSAWLKCHYPAAFACALLNAQPMGFYAPAQIVTDAKKHGVRVLPVDVMTSGWDCGLEPTRGGGAVPVGGTSVPTRALRGAAGSSTAVAAEAAPTAAATGYAEAATGPGLRLGLRLIKGFSADAAERIEAARQQRPFTDVADLIRRAALDARERECLAAAGALRRLAGHRHRAYWEVAAADEAEVLREAPRKEARVALRPPDAAADTFADYAATGLSLGRHPLSLIRQQLRARRIRRADELGQIESGRPVRYAGLVTMRQRPATATGVTFVTLEDESGLVNVVVWHELGLRQRRELLDATVLGVEGVIERKDGVQHLIAGRLRDFSDLLPDLAAGSRDFH